MVGKASTKWCPPIVNSSFHPAERSSWRNNRLRPRPWFRPHSLPCHDSRLQNMHCGLAVDHTKILKNSPKGPKRFELGMCKLGLLRLSQFLGIPGSTRANHQLLYLAIFRKIKRTLCIIPSVRVRRAKVQMNRRIGLSGEQKRLLNFNSGETCYLYSVFRELQVEVHRDCGDNKA
jgi:hypothetical protein